MFDHSINNMIILDEETQDKHASQLKEEMKVYQEFI